MIAREAPERRPAVVRPTWLVITLTLVALVTAVALVRQSPPAPLPLTAPAPQFSAARAAIVLRELAGDETPHPVGSAAAAAVRNRLVARLQALGLHVAVRTDFACSATAPVCGTVSNVVARLPGAAGDKVVLLAAHYDSVAAGPGVADDLASVAALVEIARALRAGPPAANPVAILIDEGEETGLLGAEAFVADDPLARRVGAVVNMEARGTAGESIMFETSDENAWLIDAYARSVRRPAALSLTYEAYRRLPNNTDLTVFKRAGLAGMNFAFIGDVAHYHTPLDDLAHLDLGSLQHQGESVLAVARALAGADLSRPPAGRSVYQDLLGVVVLRWPAPFAVPLAAAGGTLVLLCVGFALRRRAVTPVEVAWGLAGFFVIVVAAAAAGLAFTRGIEALAGAATPWRAYPVATRLSLWYGALSAGGAAASLVARRAGAGGLLAGVWTAWSALALAVALAAPGASTVLLIPLLPAAVVLASVSWMKRDGDRVGLAAAVVAPITAALWMPLSSLLEATFGLAGGVAVTLPLAMVTTTVAPLLALAPNQARRARRGLAVIAGLAVVAAVTASLLPEYSAAHPERLSLTYALDHDGGATRWLAGRPGAPIPPGLAAAAPFGSAPLPPFPFSQQRQYAAAAPALSLPPPVLADVHALSTAAGRLVSFQLSSPRGAANLALFLPTDAPLAAVTADGRQVSLGQLQPERGGFRRIAFLAVPAGGLTLTLALRGSAPVAAFIADQSPGLPAAGRALLAVRPASAVPSDGGDTTVVWRQVRL